MSTYDEIERDGFTIVRNVFTRSEVTDLRAAVAKGVARSDILHPANVTLTPTQHIAIGDLIAYPELKAFAYVVLNHRVLEIIRSVIGNRIVYFGDSSMQMGEGTRGFHKDNVHRNDSTGSDWASNYNLVRFGLYLQDHAEYSGGLKVRVGSHQVASDKVGTARNLSTNAGDLVIWKLTTSHSGNVVRPRLFRGLTLHPGIENRLPTFLRIPGSDVRMSIFGTFGAPGKHLDTYLDYIAARKDFENHYAHSTFTDEARELAVSRGVELRIPMPAFGTRALRSAS